MKWNSSVGLEVVALVDMEEEEGVVAVVAAVVVAIHPC
jgi:hypothetical protein